VNVTATEGIAMWSLVQHASLPVQLVLLMLLAASVLSWTMIFRKWFALKSAKAVADRFEAKFWFADAAGRVGAFLDHDLPQMVRAEERQGRG